MSVADGIGEWRGILLIFVAIAAIWALVGSGNLGKLFNRVTKVSLPFADFSFTAEGAKEAKNSFEEALQQTSDGIWKLIEDEVKIRRIRPKLAAFLVAHPPPLSDYRATIHIADALLDDYIIQLVNYVHPTRAAGDEPTATGAGRRFSIRTGIIGRARRRERSEVRVDPAPIDIAELVLEWSMTVPEAEARKKSHAQAMVAVRLTHPATANFLAILFVDAQNQGTANNAQAEAWAAEISNHFVDSELSNELAQLVDRVSKRSPRIEIGAF